MKPLTEEMVARIRKSLKWVQENPYLARELGLDTAVNVAGDVVIESLKLHAQNGEVTGWQPLGSAPRTRFVLVANIMGEVIHRVSDAKFNGLAWYTRNGEGCHWATHWAPMPPWWPNGVPKEAEE